MDKSDIFFTIPLLSVDILAGKLKVAIIFFNLFGLKSHQNQLCGALNMAQAGCPFLIDDVPGGKGFRKKQ